MKIVALEGPSYAGKTTAITRLRSMLHPGYVVFDCYVQDAPRPGDIPPPPARDAAEQLAAFEFFMRIEAGRVDRLARLISRGDEPELVILDRSVDTNLAHVHATDRLFGFGVYERAQRTLDHLPHLVPDRTFYLDADPRTLRERYTCAGGNDGYFLHHTGFLGHTRAFFLSARGPSPISRQVIPIPAIDHIDQVTDTIHRLLQPARR